MPILVRNVPRHLDEPDGVIRSRVEAILGGPVLALRVRKRSLDARRRPVFRHDVEVEVADEEAALRRAAGRAGVSPCPADDPPLPRPGTEPLPGPVIVVGAGPAGLFAAETLAGLGYGPLVLERGDPIPARVRRVRPFWREGSLDPESNALYGEGGAGTFSDGKLTTRIHRPYVRRVLEALVACGADPSIRIDAHPHIGSDRLRRIVTALRRRIEGLGGTFRFRARADGIEVRGGRIAAVRVGGERIEAGAVILATGSSAADTYRMLAGAGVPLAPRPFQLGLRIEHPQGFIDRSRYGRFAGHPELPPATYALRCDRAHTFCMCPGGEVVVIASEADGLSTNGMSRAARAGPFANSAIVTTVGPAAFAGRDGLAGLRFRRRWEEVGYRAGGGGYRCGAQYAEDFLAARTSRGPFRCSCRTGTRAADLARVLPPPVAGAVRAALAAFDRAMPGFARGPALLLGPETRASSPVRILRGDSGESVGAEGLYPVGEGAGYAGGILSSAVDGIGGALAVVRRYRPITA